MNPVSTSLASWPRICSLLIAASLYFGGCSDSFSGSDSGAGGSVAAGASGAGATDASAGEGAGPRAGSGGAGGRASGGSRATEPAGASGEASSSAGESPSGGAPIGGEAGATSSPPAGQRCFTCGASASGAAGTKGCAALTTCDASPKCKAWSDCLRGCNDAACARQCDQAHQDVARYSYDVYACLCQSCAASCSELSVCGQTCKDADKLPLQPTPPATLAQTLLYAGGAASGATLAAYVRTFEPKYALWSDGAVKQRYIYVPPCSRIDTGDMDHWEFPVGTRLWKSFTVASASDANTSSLVETRFIHRFGPGPDDWIFAAYQWPVSMVGGGLDPTAAKLTSGAVVNANGTTHDIPSEAQCKNCHTKLPERVLGFSAFELSHALPGLNIAAASDEGLLSVPARQGFAPPGSAVAQAALGYLHANCGNCHNASFHPVEPPPLMRLLVTQGTVATTDTFKSLVNVPTQNPDFAGYDRIEPGKAEASEIIMRMQRRPPATGQMPPLGTKVVHTEGVASVAAWINSLPP